jgi:hypothetical protein
LEDFKDGMKKTTINKKNLKFYIDAFMNRVDISGKLKADMRCDALLVVGAKSSQVGSAEYMHSQMDKVSGYKSSTNNGDAGNFGRPHGIFRRCLAIKSSSTASLASGKGPEIRP